MHITCPACAEHIELDLPEDHPAIFKVYADGSVAFEIGDPDFQQAVDAHHVVCPSLGESQ